MANDYIQKKAAQVVPPVATKKKSNVRKVRMSRYPKSPGRTDIAGPIRMK